MDSRFFVTRDELQCLHMDIRQVQLVQNGHEERISKIEKRQADDVALKSVWNSPFPGVLGGTPQHGPVQTPSHDMFDDLDEQGEHLLGSLHLGPAEEEPARRGAASRANSVRFDESALHGGGAGWGQGGRHSSEFAAATVRPAGALLMERSSSHKSDGRHSSAGHSVHSHHSVASGRASSLGLDTGLCGGAAGAATSAGNGCVYGGGGNAVPSAQSAHRDDSPVDYIEPPPGFLVLGTVPSIIRCWITMDFAPETLLYADVCSGSQKSTVDYSLLQELGLASLIRRDSDGVCGISLAIYLAEAMPRPAMPRTTIPSIVANLEVVGLDRAEKGAAEAGRSRPSHSASSSPPASPSHLVPYICPRPGSSTAASSGKKGIRLFLGSDTLRAHSADILFSQNQMSIFSSDRCKFAVPFARPEDEAIFKHLSTVCAMPDSKPRSLNATAAPFVSSGETRAAAAVKQSPSLTRSRSPSPSRPPPSRLPSRPPSRPSSQPATMPEEAELPKEPAIQSVADTESSQGTHSPLRDPAESVPGPVEFSSGGRLGEGGGGDPSMPAMHYHHPHLFNHLQNHLPGPDPDCGGPRDGTGDDHAAAPTESRRDSGVSIFSPWRHGGSGGGGGGGGGGSAVGVGTGAGAGGGGGGSNENGYRESGSLSGYQPAGRSRNMKVLRSQKTGGGTSSAKTGFAYEPAPVLSLPRSNGESRRKSQAGERERGERGGERRGDTGGGGADRWESKRSASVGGSNDIRRGAASAAAHQSTSRDSSGRGPAFPRLSNNPVGDASAFSWMNGNGSAKPSAAAMAE